MVILIESELSDRVSRWLERTYYNDCVLVDQDAAISVSLKVHSCGPSKCDSLVLQRDVDTSAMEHNLVAFATKNLIHDMVSRLVCVLVSNGSFQGTSQQSTRVTYLHRAP